MARAPHCLWHLLYSACHAAAQVQLRCGENVGSLGAQWCGALLTGAVNRAGRRLLRALRTMHDARCSGRRSHDGPAIHAGTPALGPAKTGTSSHVLGPDAAFDAGRWSYCPLETKRRAYLENVGNRPLAA